MEKEFILLKILSIQLVILMFKIKWIVHTRCSIVAFWLDKVRNVQDIITASVIPASKTNQKNSDMSQWLTFYKDQTSMLSIKIEELIPYIWSNIEDDQFINLTFIFTTLKPTLLLVTKIKEKIIRIYYIQMLLNVAQQKTVVLEEVKLLVQLRYKLNNQLRKFK